MKRIGAILCLAIILILTTAVSCFAAPFELTEIFPEDGSHSLQPNGVAIKMKFSQDVSSEKAQKANKDCFKIVDGKNKKVPFTIFYSEKRPNDVLLVIDKNLTPKGKYKFTLSSEFQSSNESLLGEQSVINFQIRDTAKDANINMALMGVMVVGMIFFTSRATKKAMEKEQKQQEAEGSVNPYKLAKETGKPVAEIIAQLEKEKAKAARKQARLSGPQSKKDDDDEDYDDGADPNHYRVKGKKPISAGGSTYKTGRRAKAEKARAAAKAKAAAKNTNPKNATGKKKNKKK